MKLKNEELYADSAELMKMRSYLDESLFRKLKSVFQKWNLPTG